jgi:hypothetical protein
MRRRTQIGTFGAHLRHFARSVDIVDQGTLVGARELVHEYVRDELHAAYFELALGYMVDEGLALRTLWSTGGQGFSTTVKKADGRYSSQIAVSFDTGRPLWIVNPQRKALRRADSYVDQWSNINEVIELPSYREPINRDLLTLIVIPLRRPSRILGVLCLESTAYLDITEFDTEELELLADTLAILLDLYDLNQVQMQGTRDAIAYLRRIKDDIAFPQLTKPQMFVGFSSRADEQVTGILNAVLDEFSDRLRIIRWNKIVESGTITAQIAEVIAKSRFGLCYFSEPDGESKRYRDNPNVVFEAGMLQALTGPPAHELAGWIPVREENSPQPPFDFAGERIELVPRGADNQVNEELLRSRLRGRIQRLLEGHGS